MQQRHNNLLIRAAGKNVPGNLHCTQKNNSGSMQALQCDGIFSIIPRLIACWLLIVQSLGSAAERQPNILLIVGDDMGYADVGFHGCKDIPTPHLDALSSSGARFSNGYVSGPYCSPTRAGLLTGRYQVRFGHEFNPGAEGQGLPTDQRTLANRLQEAGYHTGLVGKWHLGSDSKYHPQQRGFQEFFGFLGGSHSYFDDRGILRGHEKVEERQYLTDAFGREASSFVERHRDHPWFLYLAFNAVHTPMHATEEGLSKFSKVLDKQRQTYNAMMAAMDDAIGAVMQKLQDTKQTENTLIMFISDNGGPTMVGVTVNGSLNHPLRGSKRTTLEGGIRVPMLVNWPKKIRPSVYENPVIQLDLHATALAAAGINISPDWKLDGVNLLPYLSGENHAEPHSALYWRFGEQMAIRAGDWKLVRYDLNADSSTGRRQGVSDIKLYNLATDIHEDIDLSRQHPEKVRELQGNWNTWNQSNIEPLWGGRAATRDRSKNEPAKVKKNRQKAKNDAGK